MTDETDDIQRRIDTERTRIWATAFEREAQTWPPSWGPAGAGELYYAGCHAADAAVQRAGLHLAVLRFGLTIQATAPWRLLEGAAGRLARLLEQREVRS